MQAYVDPLNRCFFNKSVLAVFFFFYMPKKANKRGRVLLLCVGVWKNSSAY